MNETEKLNEVDASTLKQWMDRDDVVLIDVREYLEYAEEHIPKSHLFPSSSFDPRTIPAIQNKKVAFHCQAGKRSATAAVKWAQYSGNPGYSLKGGILAWKQAGFATVSSQDAGRNIQSQVFLWAGIIILLGALLVTLVSSWFLILPALVGAVLVFTGLAGNNYLAILLSLLPSNRHK